MISNLQYITQDHPDYSHFDLVKQAVEAGVDWIQLRMKNVSDDAFLQEALKCREYTFKHEVKLIINDRVKIAKQISADGVHVGQNDMLINEVREILGDKIIIGGTANTLDQIMTHVQNGADYVGVGPFRFTKTKDKLSPILGLDGYDQIIKNLEMNQVNIPIIAIGGIELNDVLSIKETGVHGIAVSGLITHSENQKELINSINKALSNGIIENCE